VGALARELIGLQQFVRLIELGIVRVVGLLRIRSQTSSSPG
jgi:hypothetical protein